MDTIYTTRELVADFPAYAIYTMPEHMRNRITHGQVFAVMFHGARYGQTPHFFKFGSIFGYAVENSDDPIASYEGAKRLGHKVRWANGMGATITAWKRDKEDRYALAFGDVIQFEGTRYKLVPAPNQNVGLKELVAVDA